MPLIEGQERQTHEGRGRSREAARKGKLDEPCDKEGCDLTCAEEELADLLIRTMDCAVVLGVDLGRAVRRKSQYNAGRPFMHGKKA